jgi:hydrogenase expression/formation protein HypD
MLAEGEAWVVNRYPRVVRADGNPGARALIEEVFEPVDAVWRGIGVIPASGLHLRDAYHHLDAAARYEVSVREDTMPAGCSCGDVLRGKIVPNECSLFGRRCTPESPVGPCMVSSEGSCAAYYRYGE